MGFVGRIDAIAAGEVDGPSPLDHHLRHLEQSTVRLSCVDVLADGDRDRCSGASKSRPVKILVWFLAGGLLTTRAASIREGRIATARGDVVDA